MSAALPSRPDDLRSEPDAPGHVDPLFEVEEERRRWEVRVAQWRALALAQAVFGVKAAARLEGRRSTGQSFRGLLRLDVPFEDLGTHRERERTFVACAAQDPVLNRVPFVYVFEPVVP